MGELVGEELEDSFTLLVLFHIANLCNTVELDFAPVSLLPRHFGILWLKVTLSCRKVMNNSAGRLLSVIQSFDIFLWNFDLAAIEVFHWTSGEEIDVGVRAMGLLSIWFKGLNYWSDIRWIKTFYLNLVFMFLGELKDVCTKRIRVSAIWVCRVFVYFE